MEACRAVDSSDQEQGCRVETRRSLGGPGWEQDASMEARRRVDGNRPGDGLVGAGGVLEHRRRGRHSVGAGRVMDGAPETDTDQMEDYWVLDCDGKDESHGVELR